MLVERNKQSLLLMLFNAFAQQLRAEYGFSDSGYSDNHGGGAIENPPSDQVVERLDADNRAPGGGSWLLNIVAQRRLHAAITLRCRSRI